MGSVVSGLIDDVISFIGRPFGIYTHNETFTDLQVSNLLTPGEADKFARKNAKHQAKGNANVYYEGYRSFQRDYRKKYGKKFLENAGYLPTSTATTYNLVESQILTYLKQNVDSGANSIVYYKDKYLSTEDKVRHAINNDSNYDAVTSTYTDNGAEYTIVGYEDGGSDDTVKVVLRRDYIEVIKEYLEQYSYDNTDSTLVFNGTTYLMDEFDSTIYTHLSDPSYRVQGVNPDDDQDTVTFYMQVQEIDVSYTNVLYAVRCTYVEYLNEVKKYWIAASLSVSSLYANVDVDITAIIPLKENDSMVDLDSKKLDRMLRKLNLSGEQLRSSIENPDMDSAYLLTGISPAAASTQGEYKAMFQMFDLMSQGGSDVSISIDSLNMQYTFSVVKQDMSGSIGKIGTYDKVLNGNTMEMKYQATDSIYRSIVITGFSQTYTVNGYSFTGDLSSTGGYTRLVIPLDILNGLRYKEFVEVYEAGLCLLAYSMEVVEVKWYETAAFGTLLKIVSIVLIVTSMGAGAAVFGATNAMFSGMVAGLGITGAGTIMALYTATVMLESLVIGLVVSEIAGFIGDKIGGVTGAMVQALVSMYIMVKMGIMDFDMSNISTWFSNITTAMSSISQAIAHNTQEMITLGEAAIKDITDKTDDLQEKLKEYEDSLIATFDPSYPGKPVEAFKSIEDYCNGILYTNVELLADGYAEIDYALQINTNVVSGIG